MLDTVIKTLTRTAVAGAFALTLPLAAQGKELRFVHAYPTAAQHHQNATWFADEVTKRTDGSVTFRIFPSAQLMPINQELPAIASGQVSMTYSIAPIAASVEPLWGIMDLPFLFAVTPDNTSVGREFFKSEKGGGVLASAMEARGFKLISIAPTDYPSSFYLTTPKVIESIENLKGLKIRAPGGKIAQLAAETYGYSAIAIAGAELVPALTQGVVDGGILPPIYALDNKLPLKGLTIMPYSWAATAPIVMSLAEFNALTPEEQGVMMEVGAELRDRALDIVEERTQQSLDELKAAGAEVLIPDAAALAPWVEAARPIWDAFVADNGEQAQIMVDEAKALSGL
ncbi:TRAP transporter substrate-binding protein [Sulfitobacter sp. 1A12126]|uniref:TRAP transporter substrate-binding protein n=1 Tax=Sulfitobacter sp. 1A12126 TaxID=3368591 RepID=UPI00374664E2